MSSTPANTKRIAKNTLVLYVRMLFLMLISLYTSRVILEALGVEDFGVYNVVGGFVALFAIVSRSLSGAASRFLNYEMGKGNNERLRIVFSTTLSIQFLLAIIILILVETVGLWFLNNKMVIPIERLNAANWVFQFSVLTFCFNLLTTPYNAAIIAHERMSVFAYFSIFEGIAKLLICYMVIISPFDRLIIYSFFIFLIQFIVRSFYQWYCKKYFQECRYRFVVDKPLLKEIFSYSFWNLIGTSSVILRSQGGNVLINLFGGPVVNAARAIANQVLHAVHSFVDNFFTALRPQIMQSYASGDWRYMMTLIFQGARLSYYMLFLLCLPLLLNTDYLLHFWLKTVPDHSVLFVRLTLVFSMIESISSTLIIAQLATGKIRNYQLAVGGLQIMNFPVSYVILKCGGVPETILYVAIFIGICCLLTRIYMLRNMINLSAVEFIKKVIINISLVSFVASIIPYFAFKTSQNSFTSFFYVTILCFVSTIISILYVGCNKAERQFVYAKVEKIFMKVRFGDKKRTG